MSESKHSLPNLFSLLLQPSTIEQYKQADDESICDLITAIYTRIEMYEGNSADRIQCDLSWHLMLKAVSMIHWKVSLMVSRLGLNISFLAIQRLQEIIVDHAYHNDRLNKFANIIFSLWVIKVNLSNYEVERSVKISDKVSIAAMSTESSRRDHANELIEEAVATLEEFLVARENVLRVSSECFVFGTQEKSIKSTYDLEKAVVVQFESIADLIRLELGNWYLSVGSLSQAKLQFASSTDAKSHYHFLESIESINTISCGENSDLSALPGHRLYELLLADNEKRSMDYCDRLKLAGMYEDSLRRDIVQSMNCILSLIDSHFTFDLSYLPELTHLAQGLNEYIEKHRSFVPKVSEFLEFFFADLNQPTIDQLSDMRHTRPIMANLFCLRQEKAEEDMRLISDDQEFELMRSILRSSIGIPVPEHQYEFISQRKGTIRSIYKRCFRENQSIVNQIQSSLTKTTVFHVDPFIQSAIASNYRRYSEYEKSYKLLEQIVESHPDDIEISIRLEMLHVEINTFLANGNFTESSETALRLGIFCRTAKDECTGQGEVAPLRELPFLAMYKADSA
ncbi:hypothetical protein ACOME3_005016 [Neoechinorhynchus agilis]